MITIMEMINNSFFHTGFYNFSDIKQQLLNIKSEFPIKKLKNGDFVYNSAEIFLHGVCDIFAFALHKRFGYRIIEIKNKSGSLVHWCCVAKKDSKLMFIDVRGITSNYEEFIEEFKPDIGSEQTKKYINNLSNYMDVWNRNQIKFADKVINEYYNYYVLE